MKRQTLWLVAGALPLAQRPARPFPAVDAGVRELVTAVGLELASRPVASDEAFLLARFREAVREAHEALASEAGRRGAAAHPPPDGDDGDIEGGSD